MSPKGLHTSFERVQIENPNFVSLGEGSQGEHEQVELDSQVIVGADSTQIKMPYVSDCFVRNINSEMISGLGASIHDCSVGLDGASAVPKEWGVNDLMGDDKQADAVCQKLNGFSGKAGNKNKGRKVQKGNTTNLGADHVVNKVISKEQTESDLKAKEKSFKAWEQDLKKREQHLSDNVKQLASVRSKVVQQEHIINELENSKKIFKAKISLSKKVGGETSYFGLGGDPIHLGHPGQA